MNNRLLADAVVDLQYGDSGKGKVTHSLLKSKEYTHCLRFGGGHNAGHTIYHNGNKIITHVIPSGILYGIKSIIGPGCVVNEQLLLKEIKELEDAGIQVAGNLFIDCRAHIITQEHLAEDSEDTKIGTTKRGTGPAYRDKYNRTGKRANQLPPSNYYQIIDVYEEFFKDTNKPVVALYEGAQGFGLDIDWGDYPYVTSSTCTVAGVVTNGIPPKSIRKIFGVIKAYQTYVGAKKFQPDGEIFDKIREAGGEYGATTGRARQINYLDIDQIVKAARINGVTSLIVNKTDILQQLNIWKLYQNGELIDLESEDRFIYFVKQHILKNCPDVEDIVFSYSPISV